jgi:hypothetical protein
MYHQITTTDEKEEYILTKEEEESAIFNAIESLKKHKIWKMQQKGVKEGDMLKKLAVIDFEKEVGIENLLKIANSNKLYCIWQKENIKKIEEEFRKKREELKKICTAKYMFNVMSWSSKNIYGKKLIVNEDNSALIKTLCFFVSRDKRFETELGYSFNKGLLIRGIAGLGKTFTVRCLANNELNPILMINTIEVTEEIKEYGSFNIELGENKIIFIDDFGTEETVVNHYGTKIFFFRNFIEKYYFNNKNYSNLIISTNLNNQHIEDSYGFRVRSRISEMFNIITVKGTDMRKELF